MLSVFTSAHNEARLISGCPEAVQAAARRTAGRVEQIVVLNRCSEDTGKIAVGCGARVIAEDRRNIVRVCHRDAEVSRGRLIVTIDADSRMTPNMTSELLRIETHYLRQG